MHVYLRRLLPTVILFLFCAITQLSAQTDWKLRTEKDGIKIFSSEVSYSKVKALKVECNFKASATQLVAALLDIKNSPKWIYHTKSATLVKQVSPSELYYYSEVFLPWPVENRDFVAHLTVTQNKETKVVTMDGPAVPGYVDLKDGIVRIQKSKGEWVITPLTKNEVKVIYTLQVDPGGLLPPWLVNLLATEGPLQTFKNLKIAVQNPAYKTVKYAFITE
ncbi:MAG: lipid-binding protein [Pedobacter sp.]|nr:MAG: lipid-binding protein [Pedobacter sp.]